MKRNTQMKEPMLIGVVSAAVIKVLGDNGNQYKAGDMIFIGESNVKHMKRRHSSVYKKYGDRLPQIVYNPDYVGINAEDGSLEYIKVFDDHVKLVVRIAGDEKLYVRSMYTVLDSRTDFFVKSGRLKPLTKEK